MKHFYRQNGFSLVEVMVAVVVFTVAIFGITALIASGIANASLLRNRLIAANLAQEGIEIVRNIRDNNFLASGVPWDQGLPEGDFWVDWTSLSIKIDPELVTNPPLIFHPSSGYYDYARPGDASIFSRKMNISKLPVMATTTTELVVQVTVSWRERGRDTDTVLKVEDHLFDWQ